MRISKKTTFGHSLLVRPPHGRNIQEWSNWASQELAADLPYSKEGKEFADFAEWLEAYMDSEAFQQFVEDFLASREPWTLGYLWVEHSHFVNATT